ncbi:MAG: hypothetical protein Q9225_003787, partial [Loekoesia sp. 1 TL-2023]
MYRLPQELVTHIASFVEREDDQSGVDLWQRKKTASKLPPYATVSRKWQLAIESRTFRSIRLRSPELSYLAQILTGHRRAVLGTLAYQIVLPTYKDNRCAKFETNEEMERNSQAFTYAVHALFQFLKTLEVGGRGKESRSLSLEISDIYSPMDGSHRGPEKYEEDREQYECGKRHDLWQHRYEHSILRLLEHPKLPTVSFLSSFHLYFFPHRCIEPKSAVSLAAKLSNIQSVTLHLSDNEKKHPHIRQQTRYGFATALPTLSDPSLRHFTLGFYHEDSTNQYFSPPSALLPSEPSIDHLSRALHTLSQSSSLTSLTLNPIVISPDLYWPANPSTPPAWPNIRHYHVEFDMTTPNGHWYFVRDPSKPIEDDEGANDSDVPDDAEDENDTDSDTASSDSWRPDTFNEKQEARAIGDYPIRMFRTLPSDAYINPLVLAMARAAAQMPQLQSMSLTTSMRDPDSAGFELFFHAATHVSNLDSDPEDADKARLYWIVGSWRPDEEVLKVWREGKEGLQIKFIK